VGSYSSPVLPGACDLAPWPPLSPNMDGGAITDVDTTLADGGSPVATGPNIADGGTP
jgi:hypothetical protein